MKGVDSIPFDDTKTVIHIAFTYFRDYKRRLGRAVVEDGRVFLVPPGGALKR